MNGQIKKAKEIVKNFNTIYPDSKKEEVVYSWGYRREILKTYLKLIDY